ncbi:MAG: long-chain fatty acid--CoA ligase [Syntrophobacteraceae bacterium]|nr:long-chain fatty acid--CoA ligase [Syntrophobacteraceae bacterium]
MTLPMSTEMTYLDKPWLKSYKLGPYRLDPSLAPLPHVPVYKFLYDSAEKFPNQTAVLFQGRKITYSEVCLQVDQLSTALAALGVKKGDRVCIFLPNCTEFILSDWAIMRAGAVVVPTSVLRSDEGLLHELKTSASKVILCREENLDRVLGLRDQCAVEHIIVTSKEGYDVKEVAAALPPKVHDFRGLLTTYTADPPQVAIDPLEDLCELAFTGGATGKPKGVMITHFNRSSDILLGLPWVLKPMLRGFVGKASVLIPIPLFHTYGHFVQQTAAYLGLRVILLPDSRDIPAFIEQIQQHRPFLIPGVPTQFMHLAEAGLSRMNSMLLSGSAPLPAEVAEAISQKTGMPISEGYGLTETSPMLHFNVSSFSRILGFMAQAKTGIGVPLPDTECRLVDPQTGLEVPFGEAGEIVVRGPQVMRGYWPEPGSGLTPDGWLHTGDIAVMDEDGYFRIVDRTKDMVNVSGMKVYTTNVDEVLFKHPAILMAAAYGVPDPKIPGSERVMATILVKDEYRGKVDAAEIREHCKKFLSPYEVPAFIEFREEMPLTVSEKVFKKVLRDEAIEKIKTSREGS